MANGYSGAFGVVSIFLTALTGRGREGWETSVRQQAGSAGLACWLALAALAWRTEEVSTSSGLVIIATAF